MLIKQQATSGAARQRDEADLVILELIRLVTEDSWTPRRAAATLRRRTPNESALREARRCVLRALADRRSTGARRAAATLDAALELARARRPLTSTNVLQYLHLNAHAT